MKLKYYGVRGSIPTPGLHTVKYGGNTPCVAIWNADNLMILDGGTGLRVLGDDLMNTSFGRGQGEGTFLFSHLHWDHIQGFPFFKPAYIAGNLFKLYGPSHVDVTLEDAMRQQQQYQNFPVLMEDMPAAFTFTELKEGQTLEVNGMEITNRRLNHPGGVFAYRISSQGKSIVYATDTEHDSVLDPKLLELADNADILIYDTTYTPEQYKDHVAWGHSTYKEGIKIAKAANVKALHLFHYDPSLSDETIDAVLKKARKDFPNTFGAQEGWEITL
ncbi:MAG: MBL fold metallo-hydrolase [Deltaproteobacteria bacterium]|nr:MBL fold metallo-hydrolase [Deltaproteobacteria bacterium]MBW2018973.1 MBL fold metallo-hydrolase [Deltaproteobacteria bacterium]MBW2073563.1 MBL fold metallo-hydrolase [Deltaproteobacteria bacterium]